MPKTIASACAVLALTILAGCSTAPPLAPPGPPVANATPPSLPRDPALGPAAAETPATDRRSRGRAAQQN
jgi:hypothetical protein